MLLSPEFEQITIKTMLAEHPHIGQILTKYKIDCVTCGSGSCLFKNVIATHAYDPKKAILIEKEISDYLVSLTLKVR